MLLLAPFDSLGALRGVALGERGGCVGRGSMSMWTMTGCWGGGGVLHGALAAQVDIAMWAGSSRGAHGVGGGAWSAWGELGEVHGWGSLDCHGTAMGIHGDS